MPENKKNAALAALTKLLMAITVSIAVLWTNNLSALSILTGLEIIITLAARSKPLWKGLGGLAFFAVILAVIQLLFSAPFSVAIGSALKMFIMAVSLLILVATTSTQEITASLVKQCHLPYEYAFMITAVLRFVPDLLKESKAVREAQACRGFHPAKNPLRRIIDYMMIIKPMVFKAIARSENMAISLELRGFSHKGKRTFLASRKLAWLDYSVLVINALTCIITIKSF